MRAEPMKRSRRISAAGVGRRVFPRAAAKTIPRSNSEDGQIRTRINISSTYASKPLLYLGSSKANFAFRTVEGEPVTFEGEDFYRIANYDRMRPFFMTVVSDADHWMFISSNGGL